MNILRSETTPYPETSGLPGWPDARAVPAGSTSAPPEACFVESALQARALITRHSLKVSSNSLTPELFWATVEAGKWRPRVVCVKREGRTVGLVYLKERLLAGVPTGLVHGDFSMRSKVDAAERDRDFVLSRALDFLFSRGRVFGAILYMPPNELPRGVFSHVADRANVKLTYSDAVARHSRLLLPDTYESFLQSLGQHTRRNLRYYRRRFEGAGHSYLPDLSRNDFQTIARELQGKSRIPTGNMVQRSLDILDSAERPLVWALRGSDGRWLSVLTGWREEDKITLVMQMNSDLAHPRDSISMVLRGYVLESLIETGVHTVDFWWGLAGPLALYARSYPAVNVTLQSKVLHRKIMGKLLNSMNTRCPALLRKV